MKSKRIILILLLVTTNFVISQNCKYTFSGIVEDFHDKSVLADATIYIKNLNKYTVSDINGKFEIPNLCKGKITVEVAHLGCETQILELTINDDLYKIIDLEHHLEEIEEVHLSTHAKIEETSIEQSIKQEVIQNFSDKSLGDALNTISGVSSLNTGSTIVKPMIHGMHSSRLLIINNNVRMFDQDWGDEHAPTIDINSAHTIQVVKGANTLRYGSDAIGGLVLLKPKKYAVKDSLFGSSILSFNSNGLGGSMNTEIVNTYKSGFYLRMQSSLKRYGDFKSPDYHLTNTGVRNINSSFRFGYNNFKRGFDAYYSFVDNQFAILQSSHIGNVNDLVRAINSEEPRVIDDFSYDINTPNQSILHHLGKFEAYQRFKDFGKLTTQLDFQINRRKEFDTRVGDLKDVPVIDLRLFTTSFQPNLRIDSFDDFEINTGLLGRFQQNDAVSGTGANQIIPDFEKYDFGTYATVNYQPNLITEISAGIRYDFSHITAEKRYSIWEWNDDYNYDELFPEFDTGEIVGSSVLTEPEFNFHCISASLGMSKHYMDDYTLLLNYGLASRVPNPAELFSDGLHHSTARLEIGFLTMEKENAHKFSVALERKNHNFGFSINPYYNYINGYIQLIPSEEGTTTTIRGAFPVWEYNQVDAQIFGIDIDVNKKINDQLSYTGNFSWLRGDNFTDDIPLIHMPGTNFTNSISYKNKELYNLTIRLQNKTVLQQNRYPDYNFWTLNPQTQQQVYVDISSTPPTYSLVNFNSSATFKVFKKGSLKVEFNIDNVLNTSYRDYLNRLRYYANELGRNFNIKLKLNY